MGTPVLTGSLDNSGHPIVKIEVFGLSAQFKKEFEAMIDTGFTGFLMMPLVEAFPLALTLYGTSNWTLADGSSQPKLLAFGSVVLAGETSHGVIVLEPNATRPLLGMEFLRKNKKTLLVSSTGCTIIDENFIEAAVKQATKSLVAPPKPPDAS